MFSSSKKGKAPREKRSGDSNNAAMFGLGMPPDEDDDDDESLMAELAALQGKPVPKKKAAADRKLVSMDEISRLAHEGMKDIDDDEDMSDLEDDEDLMAELQDLVTDEDGADFQDDNTASVANAGSNEGSDQIMEIIERESMYEMAITIAQENGEGSKVRRLKRGLEDIQKLKKAAVTGKSVDTGDLPPPVATKRSISPAIQETQPQPNPEPTPAQVIPPKAAPRPQSGTKEPETLAPKPAPRPLSTPQQTNPNAELLEQLASKQKDFKLAALKFKKSGDMDGARQCLGVSKEIDKMISAVNEGKEIDLNSIPSSPSSLGSAGQPSATTSPQPAIQEPTPTPSPSQSTSVPPSGPPPIPSTALEALQQRLEKYQSGEKEAKDGGNSSKARRMGRIVKQYQDAVKQHKAGKSIDFEELPVPPGYPPIPGFISNQSEPDNEADPSETQPSAAQNSATPGPSSSSAPLPQASRNEKEYDFLVRRQKEFKVAALNSKKQGDMDSARDYLRQAKGLDQMIVAAQNGLRVDVTQVPSVNAIKRRSSSTKSNGSNVAVVIQDASSEIHGTPAEVYQRLELSLKKQIETSQKNAKHYSLLGDLSAAKNFESLLRSSQQDLETVKMSKAQRNPVPKFHFEMKTFPIVRSHTELSDSEIEITIVRCINIPLPSGYQARDMYVYVTYEFPIPNEEGQNGNTTTVKQTINPEFNETFKVIIDRKSRSLVRSIRRQGLNLKVMYSRGFLKSDKALGQATIKLDALTHKCDIHECVDLMDLDRGRKAVGGKIEVSLKIREPLVDKDAEIVKEKWLVVDTHLRKLEMETPRKTPAAQTSSSASSLEILKFERDLAEKQIAAAKAQGKSSPVELIQKIKSCDSKSQEINQILKEGGLKGVRVYLKQLIEGLPIEQARAQDAVRSGNKEEAKLCLMRKKLLEKEIGVLKQRLSSGR